MSRKEKLYIGIENDLKEMTVEVPDSDPKPWDGKDKLKYIGNYVPRIDGAYKTSGRAKYTFDIQLPGMLHGKIIRSPHPAAMVTKIEISKAEKSPGVKAIIIVPEKLPFPVRFAGQEIIALAAETAHQAEEAARLINIEYDQQPFVVDLAQAMKKDAPVVFPDREQKGDTGSGNIRSPKIYPKDTGSVKVDDALKSSDHVVEATYRTQVQTHSPLETHGVVAKWTDDQITVWASTQGTFRVRDQVADYFDVPKNLDF